MRKFRRRGLSTIVTNLLILSIVAILGTTVFVMMFTSYSNYQNQIGSYFSSKSDAVSEYVIIEHAWFNDTDTNGLYDQTNMYLRNIGEVALNIESVYIDGVDESVTTNPVLPLSLGLDQVSALNVTMSSEVSQGTTLFLEVESDNGNLFDAYFEVD